MIKASDMLFVACYQVAASLENKQGVLMNARMKLAVALLCAFCFAKFMSAQGPTERVIVTLTTGTDPVAAAQSATVQGAVINHVFHHGYSGILPVRLVSKLQSESDVIGIELDQLVKVAQSQCVTQTAPSWGLDRISERALQLDGEYQYELTGSSVNVYVIDTGIDTQNSDFGGRAVWGVDEIDGTKRDCNGHGTAMSGTIGGTKYGVAKQVSLIAVRALNCGGVGLDSDVIAGLEWATDDHISSGKPAVAVLGFEGPVSQALNAAVNDAYNSGLGSITAAGNDHADACGYSPASAPNALSIAATDKKDQRASFSNGGTCVGMFAPGVDITSDWLRGTTLSVSGTSISAAFAAGVAALTLDEHHTWTFDQVKQHMNEKTTKNVVNETPGKCINNPWLCAPPSSNAMLYSACDI
jgi:subtilisin family serine protease